MQLSQKLDDFILRGRLFSKLLGEVMRDFIYGADAVETGDKEVGSRSEPMRFA